MSNNPLRNIPSVSELLENPALKGLVDKVSHNVVVSEVRTFLDDLRGELRQRATEVKIPAASELAERIADWIVTDQRPRLRPVINATGILLHTGLGRSPLAPSAIREMTAVAAGYASLEVDLETNERSQRAKSVEKLLIELTGAEAAFVVNNNAGATLLALAATAKGREVIVSRGHLVEIGGSYRLPDVMELSGAKLREVGTTNKTRLEDFADAVAHLDTHTRLEVVVSLTTLRGLRHLAIGNGERRLTTQENRVQRDVGRARRGECGPYAVRVLVDLRELPDDDTAIEKVAILEQRVLAHVAGAGVSVDRFKAGREIVEDACAAKRGVILAVVALIRTNWSNARITFAGQTLHFQKHWTVESVRTVNIRQRRREVTSCVVAFVAPIQDAVGVGGCPGIKLAIRCALEPQAVHTVACVGTKASRSRFHRQRHQRFNDFVPLKVLDPVGEQVASMAVDLGAFLLEFVLVGCDGVTRPIDKTAIAVVIEGFFVAGQRTRARTGTAKLFQQRNVDLLAAAGQFKTAVDNACG